MKKHHFTLCCWLDWWWDHFTSHCTVNHVSFFQTPWKDGLSKKNCVRIWSFWYYRERWYFFFLNIWSYSLGRKRKTTFLKKIYDFFFRSFEKMVFSKRSHWNIFLLLSGKMVDFSPENMNFFLWTENERWSFSRNPWKYDFFRVFTQTRKTRHRVIPPKNIERWSYPAETQSEETDILDWHPRKSSTGSL